MNTPKELAIHVLKKAMSDTSLEDLYPLYVGGLSCIGFTIKRSRRGKGIVLFSSRVYDGDVSYHFYHSDFTKGTGGYPTCYRYDARILGGKVLLREQSYSPLSFDSPFHNRHNPALFTSEWEDITSLLV